MMIQGKPENVVEQFRNGAPIEQIKQAIEGQEAASSQEAAAQPADSKLQEIQLRALKQRISKTMRISQLHSLGLRDYALAQTRQTGERVSESDVLEQALSEFFKRRKFELGKAVD